MKNQQTSRILVSAADKLKYRRILSTYDLDEKTVEELIASDDFWEGVELVKMELEKFNEQH